MSDTELKPCPFCGGVPVWGATTIQGHKYIMCDTEECRMAITDGYKAKAAAITAWNTRADIADALTGKDEWYGKD